MIDGPSPTLQPYARLSEPARPACPLPAPAAVSYNWAVSHIDNFGLHDLSGGFVLNMASGTAARVDSRDSGRAQWVLAHVVMMAVAWVLLLPTGILLVRHRWVYPRAKLGERHVW